MISSLEGRRIMAGEHIPPVLWLEPLLVLNCNFVRKYILPID